MTLSPMLSINAISGGPSTDVAPPPPQAKAAEGRLLVLDTLALPDAKTVRSSYRPEVAAVRAVPRQQQASTQGFATVDEALLGLCSGCWMRRWIHCWRGSRAARCSSSTAARQRTMAGEPHFCGAPYSRSGSPVRRVLGLVAPCPSPASSLLGLKHSALIGPLDSLRLPARYKGIAIEANSLLQSVANISRLFDCMIR